MSKEENTTNQPEQHKETVKNKTIWQKNPAAEPGLGWGEGREELCSTTSQKGLTAKVQKAQIFHHKTGSRLKT